MQDDAPVGPMTASSDPGRTRPDTEYRIVFSLAALPLPTTTVYVRSIHSSVTGAACRQLTSRLTSVETFRHFLARPTCVPSTVQLWYHPALCIAAWTGAPPVQARKFGRKLFMCAVQLLLLAALLCRHSCKVTEAHHHSGASHSGSCGAK